MCERIGCDRGRIATWTSSLPKSKQKFTGIVICQRSLNIDESLGHEFISIGMPSVGPLHFLAAGWEFRLETDHFKDPELYRIRASRQLPLVRLAHPVNVNRVNQMKLV